MQWMICWSECVVIICLLWLLPAEIKFYYGLSVRDFMGLDGGILVLLLAVLSEIALGKEFHSALVWCVFIVMELIFLLIKRCVVFSSGGVYGYKKSPLFCKSDTAFDSLLHE